MRTILVSDPDAPRAGVVPPPRRPASRFRPTARCPLVLLGIVVGAYALVTFVPMLASAAIPPDSVRSHAFYPTLLPIHAVSGAVALLIASVMISPCRRDFTPRGHQWLGYVYGGAVALSGPTGLVVATAADGGWPARIGFIALGALWMIFTAAGVRAGIRGERDAHRRAMTRSVALAFAAVSLRLQNPIFEVLGVPFAIYYPIVAWTSWAPNLLWAEWRNRRL
ncbi:MAG: DUF2306 domain-containing protein [Opitutaceae bacterium]|nr:DUF2306 domain-containing protein [Opitutaceae bacterium]